MACSQKKSVIEAALFISGRPLKLTELSKLADSSVEEVGGLLEELSSGYVAAGSALSVVLSGKSASMRLRPEVEDRVLFLAPEAEISQAMLKTLALIAHDEPVTQSGLVKSRGTRVYYYIKKLVDMELVKSVRQGRTKILTTTPKFKEYFKLDKIPKMPAEKRIPASEVKKT